jgi:hypothetical protein
MTLSITEKIGQIAVDALHEAIGKAWQAGYDKAVEDLMKDKDLGGGRTVHLVPVPHIEIGEDGE